MTYTGLPRIRLTALPDKSVLVVRGDELDESILRADAERFGVVIRHGDASAFRLSLLQTMRRSTSCARPGSNGLSS